MTISATVCHAAPAADRLSGHLVRRLSVGVQTLYSCTYPLGIHGSQELAPSSAALLETSLAVSLEWAAAPVGASFNAAANPLVAAGSSTLPQLCFSPSLILTSPAAWIFQMPSDSVDFSCLAGCLFDPVLAACCTGSQIDQGSASCLVECATTQRCERSTVRFSLWSRPGVVSRVPQELVSQRRV